MWLILIIICIFIAIDPISREKKQNIYCCWEIRKSVPIKTVPFVCCWIEWIGSGERRRRRSWSLMMVWSWCLLRCTHHGFLRFEAAAQHGGGGWWSYSGEGSNKIFIPLGWFEERLVFGRSARWIDGCFALLLSSYFSFAAYRPNSKEQVEEEMCALSL